MAATSVAAPFPTIPPDLLPVILNSPAMTPPDGQDYNPNNPESLHIYLYATLVLGLTLTTATLAARIYTKAFIMQKVGLEDYAAVASWGLFVGFCAEGFMCMPGIGIHLWNETVGDALSLLDTTNNAEIIYVPCILLVKISILLQYLRIFAPARASNKVMWWGVHVVLWSNIIFYIIEMFFDIFTCKPRDLEWDLLLSGWCWDVNKILVSIAVFNLVSDFIILLLPQYSIWRLQLARRSKIGVSAIFGLGLLVCVVSGLRVQSTLDLIQTQDASWYLAKLALWAIAEISLALISSSLPTMPRFFQAANKTLSVYSLARGSRAHGASSYADEKMSKTIPSSETRALAGSPPVLPRPSYTRMVDLERNEPGKIFFHYPVDQPANLVGSGPIEAEYDAQQRVRLMLQRARSPVSR